MEQDEQAKHLEIKQKLEVRKYSPNADDELEAAKSSLIYPWWQCLRRSADYEKALRGELGTPWDEVARDFGQLENQFDTWWVLHGRYLFANLVYTPKVRGMPPDKSVLTEQARPTLYIEVPLTLPRKALNKQIEQLLDVELAKSQHLIAAAAPQRGFYADQRMRRNTIEQMLLVWDERQDLDEREGGTNWWSIGEKLNLSKDHVCLASDDAETRKTKQRMMSLVTQRLYRMSEAMIKFAAMGDFPRVK